MACVHHHQQQQSVSGEQAMQAGGYTGSVKATQGALKVKIHEDDVQAASAIAR
jgi:hypothetical protein